jgi:hypothetical protein
MEVPAGDLMERRIAVLLSAFLVCTSAAFAKIDRHRAVHSGQSSSAALIETALKNGKITAEQALTYQVFAAFADCRLPAEFHGDDSSAESTLILTEVAAKFDSLSSAAQATLAPFLLEPYAPGGWMQQRQAVCGTGKVIQPNEIITSSLFAVDNQVLITYRADIAGEAARAQKIKTELENTIYPNLTGLMGEPLPHDDGTKWHLSLIAFGELIPKSNASGTTVFISHRCKHAPAYSEVSSRSPKLIANVTHEFMHAIQFGYEVQTPCFDPYVWIAEATAEWSEDFVYPDPPSPPGDAEHGKAPAFILRTETPLDCFSKGDCPDHEYGAYLLPFYIARRYKDPQFVRRIWDASKSNIAIDAVDIALGRYGGFDKEWSEFARYNWNREPYDDYQKWDRLTADSERASADDAVVLLGGGMDRTYEMESSVEGLQGPMTLQSLSAQYFHYTFNDPTVRSVAFLNGAIFKLGIKEWPVVPDFGKVYLLENGSKSRHGLKIQALAKINGTWETTPRDWTQTPLVSFCRDFPDEKIDELVLIYSNSNYHVRTPIEAEGLTPLLAVSNIGCTGWKTVSATFEQSDGVPLKLSWSATLKREPGSLQTGPMPTLPPDGVAVLYFLYQGTGEVNWSVDASRGGCSYQGHGVLPLDGAIFFTWNFTPDEAITRRAYGGVMKTSTMIHYTRTCDSTTSAYDQYVPGWGVVTQLEIKKVKSDGITIHDTDTISLDTGKSEWTFTTIPP